jgi:hypothetical protein
MCQGVGVTRDIWMARAALKQNRDLLYGATFNAFGHPKHNGEACMPRRPIEELRPRVFPSLPPSLPSLLLENRAAHCKKIWVRHVCQT